ncbi:MAG TPA: tetratricopeptide repeat protein [Methylophilaceae bacterium]|jgi:tetratricopeptide (TPR) repeat protein
MSPKNKILLTVGAVGAVVVFFAATSIKYWGPARAASDYDVVLKAMQNGLKDPAHKQCAQRQQRFAEILDELESAGKTDMYIKGAKVLADCQMALRQYDAAAETYTKLMRLEPQKGMRHGDLAKAYARAKKYNQAIRSAHLATQLDPEVWQAHQLKARILAEAGRYPDALQAYRKALRFVPPDKQEEIEQEILRVQEKLAPARSASPEEVL